MKKILLIIILILSLAGLFFFLNFEKDEKKEEVIKKKFKEDFFVETKKINSFSGSYEIKKVGKFAPSQDIIISGKANGRVSYISVKEGSEVFYGSNLLGLADTISNYALNYEKAALGVESAKSNYDQTKVSLDKAVEDSEIVLEKLEKDYVILQKDIEENIAQASLNLNNSITNFASNTGTLSQAEIDYNNLVKSNNEQIKSFETTSAKEYLNLKNLITDVIDFSDKILGVTDINKDENDSFDDYLGAKNTSLKNELKDDLRDLIEFKEETFDIIEEDGFEIDKLNNVFLVGDVGYEKFIDFLEKLETIFDYSIENVSLSSTDISGYKNSINAYQATLQGNYTSFLSFKSSVQNFLNTYKDNETSLRRQLDTAEENAQIAYNKTILGAQNSLVSMQTSIKNAKLNLETAIKNRQVTLRNLENQIDIAKNSQKLSYSELSKLSINSPIYGIVSEVLVDIGEDVSIGTPLVKLSNISKSEIELSFSYGELSYIEEGTKVIVKYDGNILDGYITSISPLADTNLNYKVRINVDSKVLISGNIVEVVVPVNVQKNLIPLSVLKVVSSGIGEVSIFDSGELKKVKVSFGDFYSEMVEFLGCIELSEDECGNIEIITNDLSKYDEEKFKLIKK